MAKTHYSPKTKKIERCTGNCAYGEDTPHFGTIKEGNEWLIAKTANENSAVPKTIGGRVKKSGGESKVTTRDNLKSVPAKVKETTMDSNTNLDVMSLTELEVHANELFDIWQDVACNYATAANCGDDKDAIAELAREDAIAETAYDEAFTLLQVRTYEMLQNH